MGEYGGSRSGFVSVGVASVQILPPNNFRKEAVFTNDSAAAVLYFAKGVPAVVGSGGMRLNPGGTLILEPDTEGRVWKGEVNAIATLAASNLGWTEDW